MHFSKPLRDQPRRFKFREYHPCQKCGKHCDPNESQILNCEICKKYLHRSCSNLSKKRYLELTEKKHIFICDRKCLNTILPFTQCDDIDFFSALYGEKEFPCGKCGRDCLDQTPCKQCSTCGVWDHFECSGMSVREFYFPYYFCNDPCETYAYTHMLPFSAVPTSDLIKRGVLHKCAGENNIYPKKNKQPKKTRLV